MTELANPYRRKLRACEVCGTTYVPTYSKQRSCGRTCGLRIKHGESLHLRPPSKRDLNEPLTREAAWLLERRKQQASAHMLSRYYEDPHNWTTARKRRRIFERDGWTCRACGKHVTDTVHANHPRRAVAGHIVAKATGGEWDDTNMATLCRPCNVADGVNKIPLQTHAF